MILNKNEENLRNLIRLWFVLFIGASLSFLFGGAFLVESLNSLSSRFFPSLALCPVPASNDFWLPLGLSLMTVLIYMCYLIGKNVRAHIHLVKILCLSKFASSFFFFVFFIFVEKTLAHFVGLVVDGSILLVTIHCLRKSQLQLDTSGTPL